MKKQNYTHIQKLLPEIEGMIAAGKTQREVAEHFGCKDKYVVKRLLKRQRGKQRKLEAGIVARLQGRLRKDAQPRDIRAGIRDSTAADEKQIAARFSAIRWKEMKASVKHQVIYRHRTEYPVCRMCRFF